MKPQDWERLDSLLGEWQPPADTVAENDGQLCTHVKERAHRTRLRWGVVAAGAAAAMLAGLVYLGPVTLAPSARTVEQIAVMQDLQLLNHNTEVIEHLDFLNGPAPEAAVVPTSE